MTDKENKFKYTLNDQWDKRKAETKTNIPQVWEHFTNAVEEFCREKINEEVKVEVNDYDEKKSINNFSYVGINLTFGRSAYIPLFNIGPNNGPYDWIENYPSYPITIQYKIRDTIQHHDNAIITVMNDNDFVSVLRRVIKDSHFVDYIMKFEDK